MSGAEREGTDETSPAIQDFYPDDTAHCYGCGRLNPQGHRLRTRWEGDESVSRFTPEPYHTAIPGYVYGGLIASLMDCHGTGAAALAALRAEGREAPSAEVGSTPLDEGESAPLDEGESAPSAEGGSTPLATGGSAPLARGEWWGGGEVPRFVTGRLRVDFVKPTPLGPELEVRGRVVEIGERKVVVETTVSAEGEVCARGEVVAVRMPESMVPKT